MSNENQVLNSGKPIRNELSALVKDLSFPSETDAPIEVISLNGVSANEIEEKVKADAGIGEAETSQMNFEEFTAMYGTEKDWQNSIQKNFAQKFGAALRLIQSNAETIKVYRLGGVRADLYVIGETSAAEWLGIKTKIVET